MCTRRCRRATGFYIGAVVDGARGGVVGLGDGGGLGGGEPALMSGFVEPVSLTGQRWVSLEPLAREHVPEIADGGRRRRRRQPVVHRRAVTADRGAVGGHAAGGCRSPTRG